MATAQRERKRTPSKVCKIDASLEKVIDEKSIKLMLFVEPIDWFSTSSQTVQGFFKYTRNESHLVQIPIADNFNLSCNKAIKISAEIFQNTIRNQYTGSNVDVDKIMDFVETTINDWLRTFVS